MRKNSLFWLIYFLVTVKRNIILCASANFIKYKKKIIRLIKALNERQENWPTLERLIVYRRRSNRPSRHIFLTLNIFTIHNLLEFSSFDIKKYDYTDKKRSEYFSILITICFYRLKFNHISQTMSYITHYRSLILNRRVLQILFTNFHLSQWKQYYW